MECAASRDCPAGARCLLDSTGVGSCSLDTDERCQSGGHDCPTGLICVADHCANGCTSDRECPTDAVCAVAMTTGVRFCFTPAREDAGMPVDAAMDAVITQPDAGGPDADSRDTSPIDAFTPPDDAWTAPVDGGACSGTSCGVALDLCTNTNGAVSTGVCVIRDDHRVLCWGMNYVLGDGFDVDTPRVHEPCATLDCSASPVYPLDELGNFVVADEIACGDGTVCALTSGHEVYCWGGTSGGALGDGGARTFARRAVRVSATSVSGQATHLHAGGEAYCVETTGGAVVCWGDSTYGMFGVVDPHMLPAVVAGVHVPFALGGAHLCWATGPNVSCMGGDQSGQLGPHGPTGSPLPNTTPVMLDPFSTTVMDVFGSESGTCAYLSNQQLWCWGVGSCGQLGGSMTGGPGVSPYDVGAFSSLWLTRQGHTTCGIAATDGQLECWGTLGCTMPTPGAPAPRLDLDGIAQLAPGWNHWCYRDANGVVECAGNDARGQIARRPIADVTDNAFQPVCISPACVP